MRNKGFSTVLIIAIVSIAVAVLAYLAGKMNLSINFSKPTPFTNSTPAPLPTESPTPTAGPDETANWKIYTNTQYGFEIRYPANFQALTDSNNLYGWPKAIVLFYSGGQSYDLPVEVWNSEAEYKAKYADASTLTVFKTKDGKFITLTNVNANPTVTKIISTFKFTQ